MKEIFSCVAVLFAAVGLALGAGDKEAAVQREKAAWQAVQDKKWDVFRKLLATDYRAAYREGLYNLEQELEAVRKTDLKAFIFSDVTVAFPGEDTAVLTYRVAAQGTQDGKDMSGVYHCGSVWHKSGAEWKVIFHTEVPPQP